MIRWAQAGYDVVFTTRQGGVSTGPYASLNLGRLTRDVPGNVAENRRRACAEIGVDAARLAVNRQVHSAVVREARPGDRGEEADGLWTAEPGLPLLVLAADCLPIAVVRTSGERRLAVLHAGWRGLSGGIIEAGVAALGEGALAAVIGPGIGPCCYEVGEEVSQRFDPDLTAGRRLDLWAAVERRLRSAGVEAITRLDLCTACNPKLFFSHRRDAGVTGRQGVVGAVA
jgi:polyphenol oxidase